MLPHTNPLERNAVLRPTEAMCTRPAWLPAVQHTARWEPAPSAPQGQAPALAWVLWNVLCPWALRAVLRSLPVAGSHCSQKKHKDPGEPVSSVRNGSRSVCTRIFIPHGTNPSLPHSPCCVMWKWLLLPPSSLLSGRAAHHTEVLGQHLLWATMPDLDQAHCQLTVHLVPFLTMWIDGYKGLRFHTVTWAFLTFPSTDHRS